MKRLSPVLLEAADEWCARHGRTLLFWCPGCKQLHPAEIEKANPFGGLWRWNGDANKPTLSPSMNLPGICHFFLRDGQLQFLSDSRHELAGKTVPLPEVPEHVL